MKKYEDYKREHTHIDRVLGDLIQEITKLRSNLIYLYVVVVIFIFLMAFHISFEEKEETQKFLEGVQGVSNVTWGTINGTYPDGFYDENNYPNIEEDNDDD